ncbi:MAG: cyclase family protein [Parachlamydiaceae bacterium]
MFPYFPVDLSHTLNEQSPSWDGGCGFTSRNLLDYTDCTTEVKFRVQELHMHAGIATHIDAPSHINPQGIHVDQIPIESLICHCVMIDVSQKADENYTVSVQEINEFEKAHGMIPFI